MYNEESGTVVETMMYVVGCGGWGSLPGTVTGCCTVLTLLLDTSAVGGIIISFIQRDVMNRIFYRTKINSTID